jgi:hypothetical protein
MKKQHSINNNLRDFWDTRGLVFLGYWALRKHQYGHGLLIFHATAFGVKVGNILHLKWGIFKKETVGEYVEFYRKEIEIVAGNGERLVLDGFIIKQCEIVFNRIKKDNPDLSDDDFIYTNSSTGKVLTTSTLRRELQALHKKMRDEIFDLIKCQILYREIETNAFELAWAREIVHYYRYTKQAFIKVSKRLGHRTLKDTIELLEMDVMDDVELKFDFYSATEYPRLASILDEAIEIKALEQQISGLKYSFNGHVYNIKKSPLIDKI